MEVDPDFIESVEGNPATVVTLQDGSKHVIAEPATAVVDLALRHRAARLAAFELRTAPGTIVFVFPNPT